MSSEYDCSLCSTLAGISCSMEFRSSPALEQCPPTSRVCSVTCCSTDCLCALGIRLGQQRPHHAHRRKCQENVYVPPIPPEEGILSVEAQPTCTPSGHVALSAGRVACSRHRLFLACHRPRRCTAALAFMLTVHMPPTLVLAISSRHVPTCRRRRQ